MTVLGNNPHSTGGGRRQVWRRHPFRLKPGQEGQIQSLSGKVASKMPVHVAQGLQRILVEGGGNVSYDMTTCLNPPCEQ